MPVRYSWITAFAFLLFTAASSQLYPDTRKCPAKFNLAEVWAEQTNHSADVQRKPASLTCKPVTFPSDNRLQAFTGKK